MEVQCGGEAFGQLPRERVLVLVPRTCGHDEVIAIQTPIDYAVWCARQERCSRCKSSRGPGRRSGKSRVWWTVAINHRMD